MVAVDKAVIAKIERNGKNFEVLVDPELAYELRHGRQVSISNMIAVDNIFRDSKKGLHASASDIEACFGTQEIEKVAEEIIKKGDIQLTTEMRRKKLDEKKKQIAEFISKNSIDPQTKKPHPPHRILNAMQEAKLNIDVFKPADDQVEKVLEAIKSHIPISMEKIRIEITVPPAFAGKCYGVVKSFGKEPEWLKSGSLHAVVDIPAGMRDEVFKKINDITHGEAEINEK